MSGRFAGAPATTDRDGVALGSRENFFESDSAEYDLDRTTNDDSLPEHGTRPGSNTKEGQLAFEMLTAGQTLYCPDCADVSKALSDPQPEPVQRGSSEDRESMPHTTDQRVCEDCGRLYFRGYIEQRTTDEFLDLVEEIFSYHRLPASVESELRSRALSRKRRGLDDHTIVTQLLGDIEGGVYRDI